MDNQLNELFRNFNPSQSSSELFMEQLRRNLEAVEIVKQHTQSLRKSTWLAVTFAALCGFMAGVVLTLLFPVMTNWVSSADISLLYIPVEKLSIDFATVYWVAMAGVCGLLSLSAYEIALARLAMSDR